MGIMQGAPTITVNTRSVSSAVCVVHIKVAAMHSVPTLQHKMMKDKILTRKRLKRRKEKRKRLFTITKRNDDELMLNVLRCQLTY